EPVRVERQREDERDHGDADDYVREGQGLHDRVDGGRAELDALEDRRLAVLDVADRQQEDVARRLGHRQANSEMDQVPARGDPGDDIAAGPDPLERIEHVLVAEGVIVAVTADEVEEEDRACEDDAAGEAASGRDVAEGDEPEADEEAAADHDDAEETDGVAA